jgi:hypothetical protein
VRFSLASPTTAAFLVIMASRLLRLHFRGLHDVHFRYGPHAALPSLKRGFLGVLQAIRRLLARPKYFRPEREWPGGYLTHGTRAPLQGTHNNTAERALKKAILHRKNSLFYRTLAGAHVGDVFMSLIHSAELNKVSAYEYLVAVLRNGAASASNPQAWMPWNYARQRLEHAAGPDPPG